MTQLFASGRLKIERANKHIGELGEVLKSFIQRDFYRFAVVADSAGMHNIRMEFTKPLPLEVSTIIGDAIHNQRTALDHAAWEFVAIKGIPTRHTKFPFYRTRKELVDAINGGSIKTAGTDIVDVICEVIRPYKDGGDQALCALHDLDVTDKHCGLMATYSVAKLINTNGYIKMGGMKMSYTNSTFGVGHDRTLEIAQSHVPIEFELKGDPVLELMFDKGQPLEGKAIFPTLHQLSQLVSAILDTLSRTIDARITT